MPLEFWDAPHMQSALATRHMGKVVRAYRHHPDHSSPLSQEVVAGWLYLTQSQLSRAENGPPMRDLDRLTQWARTLGIPASRLWFRMPDDPGNEPVTSVSLAGSVPSGTPPPVRDEGPRRSDTQHGALLRKGLVAWALPAVGQEELEHVVAALDDTRRYVDGELVDHFWSRIASCAAVVP